MYIGQKVECIYDFINCKKCQDQAQLGTVLPRLGKIYTIRDIVQYPRYDQPTIYLVEIKNALTSTTLGMCEQGFVNDAFRPVTDISIFLEMLKKAPVDKEMV